MNQSQACQKCGAPWPEDLQGQVCRACLMQIGLHSTGRHSDLDGPEATEAPAEEPIESMEQVQTLFHDLEMDFRFGPDRYPGYGINLASPELDNRRPNANGCWPGGNR
jgi:hypothetical protein